MRVQRFGWFLFALVAALALAGSVQAQSAMHDDDSVEATEISPETARLIADVRAATAEFRDFSAIDEEGYGKFLGCFKNDEVGGMGQHYVNGELVGDDLLDPAQPEALVYEITDEGEHILVAYEYLVFADIWDPGGEEREPPMLFDTEFHLRTNIPDTPPVWALHLWLWTHNPEGIFADYNPLVFCPNPPVITDMTP